MINVILADIGGKLGVPPYWIAIGITILSTVIIFTIASSLLRHKI
jgi:hypothetical protein